MSLVGEGQGQNPRDATGLLGSVLVYRGLEYALRIVGDLVKMKDILIYGGGSNLYTVYMRVLHVYCIYR